jgi:hypothetical protein
MQPVERESVVIPKDVVVGGPAFPLDASVTAQVKVKLCVVGDLLCPRLCLLECSLASQPTCFCQWRRPTHGASSAPR